MSTDCGCGGTAVRPSAAVRPRFFAGQLLTEDDLGLLVDYVTDRNRLRNRSLYGPGVICGLEVTCDPCGGGHVVVRPGHALDCAGNDIVVPCAERVDVRELVRDLRVGSLGADCADPCEDDGARRYGLFVRYAEHPVEPVAPYATEEPCPTPGCVPSRIREGFRFLVRRDGFDDHRHNPVTRLLAGLGDPATADSARSRDRRLGLYTDEMFAAALGSDRAVRFDASDAKRYADSLAWLLGSGEGPPSEPVAREMTEHVRALAASVARFDTYDREGRARLAAEYPDLGTIQNARGALGGACERLAGTVTEAVWPDPLRRSIAGAVVTETLARVTGGEPETGAPLEIRMLAQGTPLGHPLRTEFRADLAWIREWLLGRLDRPGLADCSLRPAVAAIGVPPPLPQPPAGSTEPVTLAELRQIAEAAAALTLAVRRFVTDTVCATLAPPCGDCADTDVLLARVELDGCDVVRICSATREQVLPGGSAYGEWLPKLHPLRELAARVCGQSAPRHEPPVIPPDGPVTRPYREGLLGDRPPTGDLDRMLDLLLTPAPGETPPRTRPERVSATSGEVAEGLREVAVLRGQVSGLAAALEGLRAQLGSAQERVSEVREGLGSRLERLEKSSKGGAAGPAKTPARRPRAPGTAKPVPEGAKPLTGSAGTSSSGSARASSGSAGTSSSGSAGTSSGDARPSGELVPPSGEPT